ncbi:ACT domain-containing protein [Sporolactobacillus pectinivorans]|uniref:ACT domain-containing protein n=1 Tax=Sporolactobacillus pectinivorans TaxID=1591408 RepID=UPI000C256DA9|nr:ACT domain-containing protein [Sporolactobacillus pectinivorans]
MERTIVAIVSSKPSVLGRIATLMSRGNLDIDSLAMHKLGTKKGISDISMLVNVEDEHQTDRLVKQLDKLIDVISVADMT